MQETFCGRNLWVMYSSRGQWFFLNSKPSIGRLNCLVYNHTPITVISDPATLSFMLHYHIRIGLNHTKCMREWDRHLVKYPNRKWAWCDSQVWFQIGPTWFYTGSAKDSRFQIHRSNCCCWASLNMYYFCYVPDNQNILIHDNFSSLFI